METHIATLQGPHSSWYFGCDVHGEKRRERLTTFSGCDIVIASDSVAMIGSPRGVGLATMWLERRKLISLPVSRDWAANDRGGTPRRGTATPPLPSRALPAPAPSEIVPWFAPPPAPSSSAAPGPSCNNEPQTNDRSGAATPSLLADEELEAADFVSEWAPSSPAKITGRALQTPPPRPPIERSPVLATPPSRELSMRGGSETPPRRSLPRALAWDRPDSDEPPLQLRGTLGTFELSHPSPTSFSPIALPPPVAAVPPAPPLVKPVARAFWRR
jgi:hypothetical protein